MIVKRSGCRTCRKSYSGFGADPITLGAIIEGYPGLPVALGALAGFYLSGKRTEGLLVGVALGMAAPYFGRTIAKTVPEQPYRAATPVIQPATDNTQAEVRGWVTVGAKLVDTILGVAKTFNTDQPPDACANGGCVLSPGVTLYDWNNPAGNPTTESWYTAPSDYVTNTGSSSSSDSTPFDDNYGF